MVKYTIRRLLILIPVMIGVLIIVFSLSYIMPGDPVTSIIGTDVTEEVYNAKKAELGLDRPFVVQLADYIWGVASRMDLGTSYSTKRPVSSMIADRTWVTIKIGLVSCIVTVILSIPIGILSAVKQYSALDYAVTTVSIILAAMPGFWLALLLILLFSSKLNWLPASGLESWKHYVLPVLSNALMAAAGSARMMRSSMLEVIRQDYITTARAKGLTEGMVIRKHALKNSLIPVITMIGTQFSLILGGSVIVETIFNIPGMGMLLLTAINSRDYPLIMGITLVISVFMCLLMVLVDLIYAWVDPRIKAKFAGSSGRKRKAVPAAKGGQA